MRPVLGRTLNEFDGVTTSQLVANISYQFWQSRFGGDPHVIGMAIRLKGHPFSIVGVLPREFHSLEIDRAPDIRLPISAARVLTGYAIEDPRIFRILPAFRVLGRLQKKVSADLAAAAILPEMQAIQQWEIRQRNSYRGKPWPVEVLNENIRNALAYRLIWRPAGRGISQLREQFSRSLKLLLAAVALLLLVVCSNITGLLLAKSEQRRREMALRLSMGASRRRLVMQLLTENMTLAIPGALLGLCLAYAASPFVLRLLPTSNTVTITQQSSDQLLTVPMDLRVFLFAVALSFVCILIFGTLPASRGTRLDIHSELRGFDRFGSDTPRSSMLQVAIQVALSMLLLAIGSLMLRTYWNLEHLNPGVDRAHIVSFTLDLKDAGYTTSQSGVFLREIMRLAASVPGLRSVACANYGIMRGAGFKFTVAPQGKVLSMSTSLNTSFNAVSPSFFEALGIRLLAGRSLTLADRTATVQPVVANRAFVESFFPHQDPIGKYIVSDRDGNKPPSNIIVGVVETGKYRSMREPDPPTIYGLLDENSPLPVILYARTYGNPAQVLGDLRRICMKVDPSVPILDAITLEQEIQNSLWQERLVALLSCFFGITAVVLAGLGLYGALAYSLARRKRELGVRIAVGAGLHHILLTVCGRVAAAAGLGLAIGIVASTMLLRLTQHLLFGVSALDPLSFFSSCCGILICLVLSAAIPSWRAVRTDAAIVLRDE